MGRAGLGLLLALPLLAGCLEFDPQSTVSWSPDGRRIAFLSEGKPWIYSTDTGAVEALPTENTYLGLAWSPRADWLAVSTASYVETFHDFRSSQTFSTRSAEARIVTLMWHPDGRKLLYSELTDQSGATTEVDVDSGTVSDPGRGIGLYGPAAASLLWAVPFEVGRRDALFLEWQSTGGAVLPIAPPPFDNDSFFTVLHGLNDYSALPLCGAARGEFLCAGSEKRVPVPKDSVVFPDRARALLAVIEDPSGKEPRLSIVDEKGRKKADGASFLKAIREAASSEDERETVRVSRLAWSPDGNWLAWVVEGRLCLWNWRNDEIRVHPAPGAGR